MIPKVWWFLLRVGVAAVWFYQGTWQKILSVNSRHLEIVASAPSFMTPRMALGAIGLVETLFAFCVVFRIRRRIMAWLQIATLLAMNTCGCLFAADKIPDIPGMLTMNFVFALVIWALGNYER